MEQKLLHGDFLFQDSINQYLDNILQTIVTANPKIKRKKDVQIFLSRYYWPNATCVGEGSLILNIGLLRRLENESQLAFIIAHELAHYTRNHVNKSIRKRVQKLNSLEAQKVIRDLNKDAYNAHERADDFFKDVVFDHRKHSRLFESEADSLAILMLQNTPYDVREGIRTLEILDNIDKEKYPKDLNLAERFDFESYPFRKRWLEKESGLSIKQVDDFAWDADSLKTHPDCQRRIVNLKRIIPANYSNDKQNIQTSIDFENLVRVADFEIVASAFELGNYGKTIFYALQLLDKYPDNAWLHAIVGICFYDIYVSQENHKLGKYLDLPSNKYKDSYREVLQFIHNLRLKNIANIAYFFIQKNKDAFEEDEYFLYAMILTADLVEDKDEVKFYKKQYLSKYKKGKYVKHVREF